MILKLIFGFDNSKNGDINIISSSSNNNNSSIKIGNSKNPRLRLKNKKIFGLEVKQKTNWVKYKIC